MVQTAVPKRRSALPTSGVLQRDCAIGVDHAERPVDEFDVVLSRLHRMRRELARLGDDLVGGNRRGTAAEHGGARGVGTATVGGEIGVGVRHTDVGLVETKAVAQQDLVHRLVPLAVRDRAGDHRDRAAGIEPHHHRLALRLRGLLDDIGKADAAQPLARAGFFAAAFEARVIRHGERAFEVLAEFAAIERIDEAGLERHRARRHRVTAAQRAIRRLGGASCGLNHSGYAADFGPPRNVWDREALCSAPVA